MDINLPQILIVVNLVTLIAGILGGYLFLRSTIAKEAQAAQEHIRQALKDENAVLQGRLERMEEDNRLLKQQLTLIIEILKRQGILVEINGEMVQVKDARGSTFTTTRPPTPKKPRASAKPADA